MRLGITGTRRGMSEAQNFRVSQFLRVLQPDASIHGDAIGADAEFHDLSRELVKNPWIIIHPPTNHKYRAFKNGDFIHDPLTFLVRDDNIIKDSTLMLATPFEFEEVLRSGTWATIRHTRKFDTPLIIVWPDGTCQDERLDKLKKELVRQQQSLLDF
jgi:hypothetical protein